MSKLDSE